jgi:hypothetical protein
MKPLRTVGEEVGVLVTSTLTALVGDQGPQHVEDDCLPQRPPPLLQAAMNITVHMTNVGIKRPWQEEFNRRYPGFHHDTPHYP